MNAPDKIKESIGGAARYSFRNGSDSPAIMGASPFGNWQSVKDSVLGVSTFHGNAATRHGEQHESSAIAKAKSVFNLTGTEQLRLIDYPYAATLDFLADGGEIIVEVKCPYQGKNSKIWKSVMDYGDPSYYVWQAHHQMMVAPLARHHILFVYDADSGDYCFAETDRSESAITSLKAEWDRFYVWMESDQADPSDGWIKASDTFEELANKYLACDRIIKREQELQSEYKTKLLALAEGEKIRSQQLTLVKSVRAGNVDYKKIPQLQGVDLEQYRGKSAEVWTIKPNKEAA